MAKDGSHVYPVEPLVFTEWSLLPGGKFKCRLYEYHDLSQPPPSELTGLFVAASARLTDEDGKPVYIPRQVADRPPVHYLKLAELERVR